MADLRVSDEAWGVHENAEERGLEALIGATRALAIANEEDMVSDAPMRDMEGVGGFRKHRGQAAASTCEIGRAHV